MSATAERAPVAVGDQAREARSPRAVTRGESQQQEQRAKVDWLHATFEEPSMSPHGFVGLLGAMLGRPVVAAKGAGIFGFKESLRLFACVGSRELPMGLIAMGGESQNGRWLLQLTGGGCGLVDDWSAFAGLLTDLEATITRCDLAVDFLDGEWSVDDAVSVYSAGGFTSTGRPPSHSLAGDWLGGDAGRTLYVGKSANGKMLRVYEKGKQLGDAESEWCRYEVQFGNKDREIPHAILTERDTFFCGAYPALADLLEGVEATRIPCIEKEGLISLAQILYHLKRSYGKAIDVACGEFGATAAQLVEECRVFGVPRRLKPSSLAAGLTFEQVLEYIKESTPNEDDHYRH